MAVCDSIVIVVEDNIQVVTIQPPPSTITAINQGPKGDPGYGYLTAKDGRVTIEGPNSTIIGITVPPVLAGTSVDPPDPAGLIEGTVYLQYT